MRTMSRPLLWLAMGLFAAGSVAFPLKASALPADFAEKWWMGKEEIGDPDNPGGGGPARVVFAARIYLFRQTRLSLFLPRPSAPSTDRQTRTLRHRND